MFLIGSRYGGRVSWQTGAIFYQRPQHFRNGYQPGGTKHAMEDVLQQKQT
ncbi:hypothetical protein MGG_14938 [Pyricularia oryzae 70-15]|uniref:Uncharacterized protein n=3 Tax=Pyricularia oryzae TaxID=318829 RepID=G4NHD0_PYRO7|nr:uncharacterized protein MGG_14938 [Pyricularia oryzae 70-15]EHA47640.1 hypothetical protein MGG_14938 [Pyricularia oryzae 70-15]ELQ39695.1 hypothetical protein OOU_Y34scaffold00487g40 [Pyricularia oryzae Y34]